MIRCDIWFHLWNQSCLLLFDFHCFSLDDCSFAVFSVDSHALDLNIAEVIIVLHLVLLNWHLLWFFYDYLFSNQKRAFIWLFRSENRLTKSWRKISYRSIIKKSNTDFSNWRHLGIENGLSLYHSIMWWVEIHWLASRFVLFSFFIVHFMKICGECSHLHCCDQVL